MPPPPPPAPILNPRTSEYGNLQAKKDFADGIGLRILGRADDPGLSLWP